MTTSTNVRAGIGSTLRANVGNLVQGRVHALVLAAAALIAVHLLDDAFVNPEPLSNASDNILLGVMGPAFVLGLAAIYPALAPGWRVCASTGLGLFAIVTFLGVHVPHIVGDGLGGSDFTAFGSLAAGLTLSGLGLTTLWRALPHLAYRIALPPLTFVTMLYVVAPITLAIFLTNTPRVALGDESPADYGYAYEDVRFENAGGHTLAGWYIPSQNGAAVVLIHGSGRNRTKTLEHAAMIAEHGYGALMIDAQGYGESEGSPVAIGWTAGEDTNAAVRYLQTRSDIDPGRIGALGLSMGGEASLLAAGTNPDIAAVVADGVEARTWEEAREQPGLGFGDYLQSPILWIAMETTELLSNVEQPESNKALIRKIAPRPVLLISTSTGQEGSWGRMLAEEGGPTVELWETGVDHIGGFKAFPEEYEERVITLFDGALLGDR